MSVFLRWGVFGILGVAALLYAYNASKRLAEVQARKPGTTAVQPARDTSDAGAEETQADTSTAPVERAAPPRPTAPASCEAELVVAQRAIELKRAGEPLDRVLRMQEIAWQEEPARRARLEQVATRWYGYEGSFQAEALRIAVMGDCQQSAPAP